MRHEIGARREERGLFGMAQQREERATELAAGRVVTTDDQIADHRSDFVVREAFAVHLGDQERAHEVVAGRRAPRCSKSPST